MNISFLFLIIREGESSCSKFSETSMQRTISLMNEKLVRRTSFLLIGGIIEIELCVSPCFGNERLSDCTVCLFLLGETSDSLAS